MEISEKMSIVIIIVIRYEFMVQLILNGDQIFYGESMDGSPLHS